MAEPAGREPTKLPPILLCAACQGEGEEPRESVEHVARMMEDLAIIQALIIVHGERGGRETYTARGGVWHLPPEVARPTSAGDRSGDGSQ